VQLLGGGGNDTIIDSAVTDTLSGGDGDDTIHYYGGRDEIDGGDGFDTLIFDQSYPTLGTFKLTSVEQLLLPGGEVYAGKFDLNTVDVIGPDDRRYDRRLIFSERADVTDVTFVGTHTWSLLCSKADDLIDVSTSSVRFEIESGAGDDTITGGKSDDKLAGDMGSDSLAGGAGNDIIYGGNGDDTLSGGGGDDHIFTSIGDDVVDGGAGNDMLSGAIGNLPGWGARERDFKIIKGGTGDDMFRDFRLTDKSATHFLGGPGTDEIRLDGDTSNITLKGIEIVRVGNATGTITMGADALDSFDQIPGIQHQRFESDFSSGGHFSWHAASHEPHTGTIIGSGHADDIDMSGSHSLWTVLAGDGNDTLKAGREYNALSGQGGRDTFIFDDHAGRS
jgi:Ca2+-binding RTX toxin-like protein